MISDEADHQISMSSRKCSSDRAMLFLSTCPLIIVFIHRRISDPAVIPLSNSLALFRHTRFVLSSTFTSSISYMSLRICPDTSHASRHTRHENALERFVDQSNPQKSKTQAIQQWNDFRERMRFDHTDDWVTRFLTISRSNAIRLTWNTKFDKFLDTSTH